MTQNKKTYIGLSFVFILSFSTALILPIDEIFKGIVTMPGVAALIYAVYQIFRDQSAYEKQLELQRKQHLFNLGVTSHMANVAFDKHVEFCEKYMSEVHSTTSTLFSEGPTEEAKNHASKLYQIRVKYSAWLSPDIENRLDEFERALLRLGAHTHLSDTTKDRDTRIKAYSKAETLWEELLGNLIGDKPGKGSQLAIAEIQESLRKVIGIHELVSLRKWIIEESSKYHKSA